MRDATVEWLLEGDPSIRWKVLRDLTGASSHDVQRARARVATEGWGARVLAEQDADGGWGGGIYSPKWTSTTYTLLLLHWLGLEPGHPATVRAGRRMWEWAGSWRVPETCVLGMLVLLASSHRFGDDRLDEFVEKLLAEQLHDGGWNCEARGEPGRHGSFNTTVIALEALTAYALDGGELRVDHATDAGREFFLAHRLYRSHRTGAIAIPRSTRFPALPQWHFDVLRGLEHFATAGVVPDDRLTDAVEVLHRARRADGRWPVYAAYPGRQWFELEPAGPSRWNTARVLRVLRWWEGDGTARTATDVRPGHRARRPPTRVPAEKAAAPPVDVE